MSVPVSTPLNPFDCQPFTAGAVSGLSCLTDTNGVAAIDFTVTMQPGDNFAVVASPDLAYISSLVPTSDGVNLKDGSDIQIPVTTDASNGCSYSTVKACRSDILTVWRRLHIEVDSMGNVGTGNKIEGTITAFGTAPNPNCNPAPPPAPPPNPPCQPNIPGYNVTTTSGQPLDESRFMNGRIVIGKRWFNVLDNHAGSVFLKGAAPLAGKVRIPSSFTLYDDDDYNTNDNLVDGDYNESIEQLPDGFKYLSAEDGNYPDGKSKNVFASAYIMPEYDWAQSAADYNQTNLTFDLNVYADQTNNDELYFAVTDNRGSKNDERDDFWIAYFLLGYQGNESEDADGDLAVSGIAKWLIGSSPPCDCYQSATCPVAVPVPVSCSTLPTGAVGAVLYQEVQQDVYQSWLSVGRMFQNIETTAPHELGHQFGLGGDKLRTTFKIMDYNVYTQLPSTTVINDIALHSEHINILRRRVKSPGQ